MDLRTNLLHPTQLKQKTYLDFLFDDFVLDSMFVIDNHGLIVAFDTKAEQLFGYTAAEVIGQPLELLIPGITPEEIELCHAQGIEPDREGDPLTGRHKNGSEFPLMVKTNEFLLSGLHGTVYLVCDRSKRRAVANILRLASTVFEHSLEGIIVTDDRGVIEYVNPTFTKATGYSAEEVIGQKPNMLQSGWHDHSFYQTMWTQLLRHGHWQGEIWNRRKNGEIYPQWLSIRGVYDETDTVFQFAAVFRDITQHKLDEEQIHHQAYHDKLTGLPNRLLFMDRLTLAISTAARLNRRVGVMFIDLDRFKLINDTLGHNLGDQLLQKVAERLTACVDPADTVARIGGDEFTVVLENIEEYQDAIKVAQRILDSFNQDPFTMDGTEYVITPSIGIALYPEDGTEVETLVRNADTAMYRAKEHSSTYQMYTPTMNDQALQRLELENDMRKALDREEFVVYYQPKIHIETNEMVGMEALVRWQHPTRGLVSPAEFIPLAEQTGLIVPLGEWVLRTACQQNKAWLDSGYPSLKLSVNLSSRQFQQVDLPSVVDQILHQTQLPPEFLELEITESIAMIDVEHAISTMYELRQLGLHISIDDFGTGYSSLSYLRKFPIQTLKIDKSFVSDITHDLDDAAIAASIIAMAHSLKLNVIAEGVETRPQLEFLRERGCNEMQGYLFSGPVPAEKFEQMLIDKRTL